MYDVNQASLAALLHRSESQAKKIPKKSQKPLDKGGSM
nr:MAG TPA: hypothetical protein [Caudoviricetes sp.]